MIEIWKNIKDYDGLYEVSNLGRIKCLYKEARTSLGTIVKYEEKIKKIANSKRHLKTVLWNNGENKTFLIKRLVAEAFVPNPDSCKLVKHKNGDKKDNRASNLEWYHHVKANPNKDRDWYQKNLERERHKHRLYSQQNKDKASVYRRENKDKINARNNERRKTDSLFRLRCSLSVRLGATFKRFGGKKYQKTEKLLGASFDIVKKHIERKFKKGMTWKNHGEWHIDHVIPLAIAKTEDELKRFCHYRNLRPVWAKENMSKGKKIIEAQITMTI